MTDDETALAPGAGDVEIRLPGEIVTLRCTPEAAIRLCRRPGGLASTIGGSNTVFSRIASCDIDEMCEVIRAGAGVGAGADKNLPTKVYQAGLFEVRTALTMYLGNLGNKGEPIVPDKSPEEEAPADDRPLGRPAPASPSSATT